MRKAKEFASVWDAIEDTPQQAASMRARSELLMALQEWVKGRTQIEAACILGVTQPRMSDLARGRIHLFSLDTLMDMATTAGLSPAISVKKPKLSGKSAGKELAAA
ncbi:MAG: XRE family transcriptional regulator [Sulfurisoma sp.]|nr:XRE family transcriptional regulator [Sulfurisoma sp.]